MLKKLPHRQGVGNPRHYDILGALQFNLLVKLDLRENHKLLDIGCGNLRAGRLFITYLKPGNYFGIEPNKWMIDQAIVYELGKDFIELRNPKFDYNSDFDLSTVWKDKKKFDYILAHSIISHTTIEQTEKIINEVKKVLSKNGKFVFTYAEGNINNTKKEYLYFKKVKYKNEFIKSLLNKNGLSYKKLNVSSPNKQTYILAERIV